MVASNKDIVFRIGGEDLSAPAFQSAISRTRGFFGSMLNEQQKFTSAFKKGFANLGLAAGVAGSLFGDSTTGRALNAAGNIGGQAALGGMAAGPLGAMLFGGIAALKEIKDFLDAASVEAEQIAQRAADVRRGIASARQQRLQGLAGEVDSLFPKARDPLAAEKLQQNLLQRIGVVQKDIDVGGKGPAEIVGLTKEINELLALEKRLSRSLAFQGVGQFFTGLGGQLGNKGGAIGRRLGNIGGAFGDVAGAFGGLFGGMGQFFQRNLAIQAENESPAQRVQREHDNILAQQRLGNISPENAALMRRRLLLGAAASMDRMGAAPGLAPLETRMLTRGRDQREEGLTKIQELLRKNRAEEKKDFDRVVTALLGDMPGEL